MLNGWYEDMFGDLRHYINDKYHNEKCPAEIYANGDKHWFKNDLIHRIDGPAREYSNWKIRRIWYQNGKIHRVDGPAIEYSDGDKEWRFHGKAIYCQSQKEFEWTLKYLKLKIL